jgi:hypothetical protein
MLDFNARFIAKLTIALVATEYFQRKKPNHRLSAVANIVGGAGALFGAKKFF